MTMNTNTAAAPRGGQARAGLSVVPALASYCCIDQNNAEPRRARPNYAGAPTLRSRVEPLLLSGTRPMQVARETGASIAYVKNIKRMLGIRFGPSKVCGAPIKWSADMLIALGPLIAGTASIEDTARSIGVDRSALVTGLVELIRAERRVRYAA